MTNRDRTLLNRMICGMICILPLLLLLLHDCTEVPDYCSAHNPLDPLRQFCHEGAAVDKCGGKSFDPSKQFCHEEAVMYKCGGDKFDPLMQFCYEETVVDKCGGKDFNPSKQVCDEETVKNQTAYLSVYIDPVGSGTVSFNPPSDDGSTNPNYSKYGYRIKTAVTVTAKPNGDNEFIGWSGAETSENLSVAVMMDGDDMTLTAKFRLKYTVTVTSAGTGFSGGGSYAAGDTVTITAGAISDDRPFEKWTTESGGVKFADENNDTTTFTMPANNVAVTANFEAPKYLVTVSGGGAGATVSGSYAAGVQVNINAGEAQAGYEFDKWTADAGVNFTDANSEATSFTMPANAVTVTATWEQVSTGGVDGGALIYGDQSYQTVIIGGKRWMAENLNYATPSGSWCYGNSTDSCTKYGRLYDWATAMGINTNYNSAKWNGRDVKHKGVCPSDWHLPSRSEWNDLVAAARGSSRAGKKLKSTNGWNSYNEASGNGTDDFGFSALPGGYYNGSSFGSFSLVGDYGNWWTATESDGSSAYYRDMSYWHDGVSEYDYSKSNGLSVRCVADE